ncbi:hypothetical protein NFJ02_03g100470 [Pycnococcus provasolii]
MPSTHSKAGGGGCGCGAAVAVLRAGVVAEHLAQGIGRRLVDDVVKKVRKAWAEMDDERVEIVDSRDFHNKTFARRLLDLHVEEMAVPGSLVGTRKLVFVTRNQRLLWVTGATTMLNATVPTAQGTSMCW